MTFLFLALMPDVRIELGVMNDSMTKATSYSVAYRVGVGSAYYVNCSDLVQLASAILDIAAMQGVEHPRFVVQPHQDKSSSNMTLPPQDAINRLESLLRDPATLAAYAPVPESTERSPALFDS